MFRALNPHQDIIHRQKQLGLQKSTALKPNPPHQVEHSVEAGGKGEGLSSSRTHRQSVLWDRSPVPVSPERGQIGPQRGPEAALGTLGPHNPTQRKHLD